jgi:hypothetical protein
MKFMDERKGGHAKDGNRERADSFLQKKSLIGSKFVN